MTLEHVADAAVSAQEVLSYIIALVVAIAGGSKGLSHIARERSKIAGANLETAEKKAGIDIIEQLQRRMSQLEREQRELRAELEQERDRRTEAEDLVDALSRRVAALEAQIRALGHEPVGVR